MQLTFNTGRLYTEAGQIITAVYRDGVIHFADYSRGVSGTIEAPPQEMDEYAFARYVMSKYDHGKHWQSAESWALLMMNPRPTTVDLELRI